MKLLKHEVELLPKERRKEALRMRKEQLEQEQVERERGFVERLNESHESQEEGLLAEGFGAAAAGEADHGHPHRPFCRDTFRASSGEAVTRGQCGADLLSGRPPLRPEHEPGIPGNAGLHWLKREGVHAAH